jgi:alpha-ribazole phosphatase
LAKLLLVRHGETELNSSQRYWGKTDVPLGSEGTRQAERLRSRLASEKIDCLYCSQLKRALTTAGIIASNRNLKLTGCSELNEIDFGKIEGLDFTEVSARFPEVARSWIERSPQLTYPGGESLDQMEKRVASFRDRLESHAGNDTVLIVAHAGILRTLICQLMGLEMKHRWMMRLDLASLSIIETYPEGSILSLLNDVSHLRELL